MQDYRIHARLQNSDARLQNIDARLQNTEYKTLDTKSLQYRIPKISFLFLFQLLGRKLIWKLKRENVM